MASGPLASVDFTDRGGHTSRGEPGCLPPAPLSFCSTSSWKKGPLSPSSATVASPCPPQGLCPLVCRKWVAGGSRELWTGLCRVLSPCSGFLIPLICLLSPSLPFFCFQTEVPSSAELHPGEKTQLGQHTPSPHPSLPLPALADGWLCFCCRVHLGHRAQGQGPGV